MSWLPADLPAWLRFWCDGLLRASLEGGAALGVAWAVGALFPRMPATVRCWLWRLAYLKLLLSLVIAGPIQLRVLPAGSTPLPRTTYYAAPAAEPESRPAATTSTDAPAPVSATSGGISLLFSGIFALWLIGVGWSILRVLREVREARRLHAGSREVEEPWIVERCAELAFLFHLRSLPRLLAAEGRGSPLLVLSGGPAVLLPASLLRDYAPEDVELMLAHELAHLKHGDLLWSWLPAVAHGLFFFHPMVWLANREWRLAHEMACDELALEITTAAPGDYGQVLLRVAAQSRLNLQTGLATVGLEETPDTLKRRLTAMKHPRHFSPLRVAAFSAPVMLVGAAALLPWRLAAADAGVAVVGAPLRYRWQAGRSYSYQVTVEGETDAFRERHSGTISYTAARRDDTVTLTHSGTLFPQRTPKEASVFPSPLAHLRPFSFGFGPDTGAGQVRIEARGRLLEQREGSALPYSLGAVGRMVLEPLPEGETAGWEVSGDREILLEEEAAARPGSFFRRSSQVRLAGRERGRYTVEKTDTARAVIRKVYELRTLEEHGGAPRLRLSGEGLLTWDRMQGVPRALEFTGTLTESSESLTRRTPVTLRYTLQESPAGSPSVPPPAGSATDTAALLRDLREGTAVERQGAVSRLAALPADPAEKPRVAAALRPLLRDRQPFTRLFAARALKTWGARADSPNVVPLLEDPESSVRWAAVETVGALAHPEGLRALAEMVLEDRDRFFASRARQWM